MWIVYLLTLVNLIRSLLPYAGNMQIAESKYRIQRFHNSRGAIFSLDMCWLLRN